MAVEVEGEEDVGDEKRPHCPTGRGVHTFNHDHDEDDNGN